MMARTLATSLTLVACFAVLPGCLQRTLSITTDPPGALVWLNDVEVGTTPLETDFTYYGGYDIRIRRPGCEPITTTRTIDPPITEQPVIDLFAEVWPTTIHNRTEWAFTLTPLAERNPDQATTERELIERAKELKSKLAGPPAEPAAPEPAKAP